MTNDIFKRWPTSLPISQLPALPDKEQEAIDAINQLSSPDGPEVQGTINGGSELTGVMVDRTSIMAGKSFTAVLARKPWMTSLSVMPPLPLMGAHTHALVAKSG